MKNKPCYMSPNGMRLHCYMSTKTFQPFTLTNTI